MNTLKHKVISGTPTLDTSAYATGDRMGSVVTLSNVAKNTGGSVKIVSVNVLDLAKQNIAFDILIFNQSPTIAAADNAAMSITSAELAKLVGVIPIVSGDYTTAYNANSQATKANVNLVVKTYDTAKDLYFVLVSRGAPTYAADSLVLKFGVEY